MVNDLLAAKKRPHDLVDNEKYENRDENDSRKCCSTMQTIQIARERPTYNKERSRKNMNDQVLDIIRQTTKGK